MKMWNGKLGTKNGKELKFENKVENCTANSQFSTLHSQFPPDTILLIDANPLIMDLNRRTLTKRGYRVLEADTISQGRMLFAEEQPDLIMMEVELPDGSGLHFCEELRDYSDIPIIFVTMPGTVDDEIAGYDAGGNAYVPKPYKPDMLVVRMEGLLRSKERARSRALEQIWEENRQSDN